MCQKYIQKTYLIEEKVKRQYSLINLFNTLKYDYLLQRGKNVFVVIFYRIVEQQKY